MLNEQYLLYFSTGQRGNNVVATVAERSQYSGSVLFHNRFVYNKKDFLRKSKCQCPSQYFPMLIIEIVSENSN